MRRGVVGRQEPRRVGGANVKENRRVRKAARSGGETAAGRTGAPRWRPRRIRGGRGARVTAGRSRARRLEAEPPRVRPPGLGGRQPRKPSRQRKDPDAIREDEGRASDGRAISRPVAGSRAAGRKAATSSGTIVAGNEPPRSSPHGQSSRRGRGPAQSERTRITDERRPGDLAPLSGGIDGERPPARQRWQKAPVLCECFNWCRASG